MRYVPVVDSNQKPLMPTTANRAASWIESKKATPFWKGGIFCVRLNRKPSLDEVQDIVVGIDPGSKKEGYCIMSESKVFLNLQADAVTWVKDHLETRRMMRRSRRQRKTPYRKCRINRSKREFLPPSTKARWQWKLRICNWLKKMYPINCFIVEDIKAVTKKGQKKWNVSFSPLEVGKKYFYAELKKLGKVRKKTGFETFTLRNELGLTKSKNKMSNVWEAHCIDAFVLGHSWLGGSMTPSNKKVLCIVPLQFYRRQLHVFKPVRGGIRKNYGGTMSLGLKRGSIIKHKKWGLCYLGGSSKGRASLHCTKTGKRLSQKVKIENISFLSYNSWRIF